MGCVVLADECWAVSGVWYYPGWRKNAKECMLRKICGDFTDEFLEWSPADHEPPGTWFHVPVVGSQEYFCTRALRWAPPGSLSSRDLLQSCTLVFIAHWREKVKCLMMFWSWEKRFNSPEDYSARHVTFTVSGSWHTHKGLKVRIFRPFFL